MNVTLVHNYYQQPGGEDAVFAAEAALLESHGVNVSRVTFHNDAVGQMGQLQIAAATTWNREAYRRLRAEFELTKPDIVHFHNTFPLVSPAGYYAAKRAGAAVVQTLHNYRLICPAATLFREGRPCELCVGKAVPWPGVRHACYRGNRAASGVVATMLTAHRAAGTYRNVVDRYVALTQFAKDKFIEGGLAAEKIAVKPNFLESDPGPGTGDGGYAIFVGRLSEEKGLDALLDAWELVGEAMPLQIVGDGPLFESIWQRAESMPSVTVVGRLERDQAIDRVKRAALLVFPSGWYEGLPMTIIESLAVGTPVLASGHGSMAAVVRDGVTGMHFEPLSAEDLNRKVQWFAQHRDEHPRMRFAARQDFLDKYMAAGNWEALSQIYELAIGDATGRSHPRHRPAA